MLCSKLWCSLEIKFISQVLGDRCSIRVDRASGLDPSLAQKHQEGHVARLSLLRADTVKSPCCSERGSSKGYTKNDHMIRTSARQTPNRTENRESSTDTQMFTAAFFTVAKRWKQPTCPLTMGEKQSPALHTGSITQL